MFFYIKLLGAVLSFVSCSYAAEEALPSSAPRQVTVPAKAAGDPIRNLLREGMTAKLAGQLELAKEKFVQAQEMGSAQASTLLASLPSPAAPETKAPRPPLDELAALKSALLAALPPTKPELHHEIEEKRLRAVVAQNPKDPENWRILGWFLRNPVINNQFFPRAREEREREAEKLLEKASEVRGASPEAYSDLASHLLNKLKKDLELSPEERTATLTRIGGLYEKALNRPTPSENSFATIRCGYIGFLTARRKHIYLTNTEQKELMATQAMYYGQIINIDTEFQPTIWVNFSILLINPFFNRSLPVEEKIANYTQAEVLLRRAIRRDVPEAFCNLGYLLTTLRYNLNFSLAEQKARCCEGEGFYRNAIDKSVAYIHYNFGTALMEQGRNINLTFEERIAKYTEAEKYLREASTASHPQAWVNLALLLYGKTPVNEGLSQDERDNRVREAHTWLERAAEAGEPMAYQSLAFLYIGTKQYERAQEAFHMAALKGLCNTYYERALAQHMEEFHMAKGRKIPKPEGVMEQPKTAPEREAAPPAPAGESKELSTPAAPESHAPDDEGDLDNLENVREFEKRLKSGGTFQDFVTAANEHETFLRERRVVFAGGARSEKEFITWAATNGLRARRAVALIDEIFFTPRSAQRGKPKKLMAKLKGWWSVRLNDTDRLVYRIQPDGTIEIRSFEGHYKR